MWNNELNITLLWISLYFILVLQPTKGAWICTGVFRESYECVVPVPVTHTPGWGIIVQLSTVACVSACYFFVHWLLHNFSQLYNHGICTLHWSIFSFSFCLQQLKRSTKHQDNGNRGKGQGTGDDSRKQEPQNHPSKQSMFGLPFFFEPFFPFFFEPFFPAFLGLSAFAAAMAACSFWYRKFT